MGGEGELENKATKQHVTNTMLCTGSVYDDIYSYRPVSKVVYSVFRCFHLPLCSGKGAVVGMLKVGYKRLFLNVSEQNLRSS